MTNEVRYTQDGVEFYKDGEFQMGLHNLREGNMTANDKQIGGSHYMKGIQPWQVIEANGMGFFDGNALKYLMRYKDKGGVEDLRKAIHYIEKLIEMETKV